MWNRSFACARRSDSSTFRRFGPREDESQVTRSLRQRHQRLAFLRGDRSRPSMPSTAAAPPCRRHLHTCRRAESGSSSRPRPHRQPRAATSSPIACRSNSSSSGMPSSNRSAFAHSPPIGPRGHLQHPGALFVEAQLGVERSVLQAQRLRRPRRGSSISRCTAAGCARRRHINRLFEERTIQRIGLIEDGQRLEVRRASRCLRRRIRGPDICFHLQVLPLAAAAP